MFRANYLYRNLCALRWLKQGKTNGTTDEFCLYWAALTRATGRMESWCRAVAEHRDVDQGFWPCRLRRRTIPLCFLLHSVAFFSLSAVPFAPPAFVLFFAAPRFAIYSNSWLYCYIPCHPILSAVVTIHCIWMSIVESGEICNYNENTICLWETLLPRVIYVTCSSEVCSPREIS